MAWKHNASRTKIKFSDIFISLSRQLILMPTFCHLRDFFPLSRQLILTRFLQWHEAPGNTTKIELESTYLATSRALAPWSCNSIVPTSPPVHKSVIATIQCSCSYPRLIVHCACQTPQACLCLLLCVCLRVRGKSTLQQSRTCTLHESQVPHFDIWLRREYQQSSAMPSRNDSYRRIHTNSNSLPSACFRDTGRCFVVVAPVSEAPEAFGGMASPATSAYLLARYLLITMNQICRARFTSMPSYR
jgi:hypothetical protein